MKICLVTQTFPRFRGDHTAPFMAVLADSLARFGHQVTVLIPYDPRLQPGQNVPFSMISYRYIFPPTLHTLGYSRTLNSDRDLTLQAYLLSPFLYIFEFMALLRLTRHERFDIISAHWIFPNGLVASLISKITGTPYTITIPGSDVYLAGKNILFRWLLKIALWGTKTVIADNQAYLDQLSRLGSHPRSPKIIRYGTDTRVFHTGKKDRHLLDKLKIPPKSPVILAVGRLVPKKGFQYLIKACPLIFKRIPSARLILIGDGNCRQTLEDLAQKLNLEEKIIFTRYVPWTQLVKYYQLANVFVMPSIRDSAGNIDASPSVLMEALACGVPTVASKYAVDPKFLRKPTGYLIQPKDTSGLAKAVISVLLTKPNKKTKQKIRKIALENFSSRVTARQYLEVFKTPAP